MNPIGKLKDVFLLFGGSGSTTAQSKPGQDIDARSFIYPLAIFAPSIGGLSETFIRRHMEDLLPGNTVVITDTVDGPDAGHWRVDCPVLLLDRIHDGEYIATLKGFLTEHHVQVLMGEYLNESLPWLEVAQDLGIRFFAHAHGYDVSRMLRHPRWRAEYLKYDQADGIITMSQVSRSRLIDLGLDAAKIHLIPYGVDVPSEPLKRAQHEIVRCLAVGRMVAKKAPILTLDAFRRAAEVCPKIMLDYIGGGNLLPAARQFIHAFKLEDRVTLHGGQPAEVVDQLMREADIFLQHSMTDPETGDEEGLPVAILEAMAHSLPVVSTRHAGIPEAVQDGLTGYLVEEGDSAGMAESLCTLAYDPELRRHLGEAGWRRARGNFSWHRERTELLRVLGLDKTTKNIDDAF
jgi:colanic acid/amylovoran biosynthesis glycosyltransferase